MTAKTFRVIALATFLLVMSTSFDVQPVGSEPRTWTVDDDGPADFNLIKEAINATSNGDTIFVHSGTYNESLVVNKTLKLLGEDANTTKILSEYEYSEEYGLYLPITTLNVTANNITVSGFTITTGQDFPIGYEWVSAVSVTGSYNLLSGNIIRKSIIGMSLGGSFNRATRNVIGSLRPIVIAGSDFNLSYNDLWGSACVICNRRENVSGVIVGNHIHWGVQALAFSGRCNVTITNNTIEDCDYGVGLSNCSGLLVYHNNFIIQNYGVLLHKFARDNSVIWDTGYPSGGNYWSDHVCIGNPSNGSQPYIIDEENVDHYPFQHPSGWLLNQLTITSSPVTNITFTINETSQSTPYTEWLPEDSYILEMPEHYNDYVWSHWLEDGNPNRTKVVAMDTDVTLTGVFYHIADLDQDGSIDMQDIAIAATAFGSYSGHPRWNPTADVNQDNKVNMKDIALTARHFGK